MAAAASNLISLLRGLAEHVDIESLLHAIEATATFPCNVVYEVLQASDMCKRDQASLAYHVISQLDTYQCENEGRFPNPQEVLLFVDAIRVILKNQSAESAADFARFGFPGTAEEEEDDLPVLQPLSAAPTTRKSSEEDAPPPALKTPLDYNESDEDMPALQSLAPRNHLGEEEDDVVRRQARRKIDSVLQQLLQPNSTKFTLSCVGLFATDVSELCKHLHQCNKLEEIEIVDKINGEYLFRILQSYPMESPV